jgi:hypothetical protein
LLEVTRGITAAMTALRLTPRSHVELRAARSAFAHSPAGPRPWDPDPIDITPPPSVSEAQTHGDEPA